MSQNTPHNPLTNEAAPKRSRRKEARPGELLEAALDLFVEKGFAATRVDEWRMTIPAIDFTPDVSWKIEPPHLQFGPATRWCYPALITDVKPSGTSSVSVSAENYDERVYLDDDSFPPVA